jgi:hypothetical protein
LEVVSQVTAPKKTSPIEQFVQVIAIERLGHSSVTTAMGAGNLLATGRLSNAAALRHRGQ